MSLARYPIARLPVAVDRNPETYSASIAFAEVEALATVGRLDAVSAAAFADQEAFAAVGRLDAVSAAAFADFETFDVGTDIVIDKFLRLINAPTARRNYVVEMTIKQFR